MAWLKGLPRWLKAISVLGTVVLAVFLAGWNANTLFKEQVSLPTMVRQTSERVTLLEARMVANEQQAGIVSARLEALSGKVDSLTTRVRSTGALAETTYCIVWAMAQKFDIGQECTLIPPPNKRE